MRAVVGAILAASARRRVQTAVVGVVSLLSTATAVLGVGLLVVSDAPFEHAFAAQAGAHATAVFDPAKADTAALAATAQRPGVVAAAGPFDMVTADLDDLGVKAATVVGRSEQDGPVDRLTLDAGRWLTGPGEIVLARHALPPTRIERESMAVGHRVKVGKVTLRLVGVVDSITNTADAWVWPAQDDLLRPSGGTIGRQMLYRFSSPDAKAALAMVAASLPDGALLTSSDYLAGKLQANTTTAPIVPFVVAFAVLGLVMSVLVVANVANGAVVAGFRVIGILKSVGFTPRQVVAVYIGQIVVPAAVGATLGLVAGNVVALPVLAQAQQAYDVAAVASLPPWVWVTVPLALLTLICLTAAVAAWRAGRIPAMQAIAVGRAPRTGRGFRLRRWLSGTRLPRPLSFGLGTLFARPGRSAGTLIAVVIGAATVVFAAGLSSSLNRVVDAFGRAASVPIEVRIGSAKTGPQTGPQTDPQTIRATIAAQPGTAHIAAFWRSSVQVTGVNLPVQLTAYDTDSSWVGYGLVSGRWASAPGEVIISSRLMGVTGIRIGDLLLLSTENGRLSVKVTGESFDNANDGFTVIGDTVTLAGIAGNPRLQGFEVGLKPGADAKAYRDGLAAALTGQPVGVRMRADEGGRQTILIMLALVATLTTLLASVAASGVFNTVVLNTRERVHEIGVLKSLGMTPRQTQTMVLSSVTAIGLLAGLIAVPLGVALHQRILPAMGRAVGTGVPDSIREVYRPEQLVALGAAGVVLAAVAALVPAIWASRTHPANALRTE